MVQILPQLAGPHGLKSLFSAGAGGGCKQATPTSDTTSAQPSTSWLRPKLARGSGFAGCHPDPDDSVNANTPHPVQTSTTRIAVEWAGFAEDAYSGIDHYEWALGGCDPAVGNYPQTGGFLNVGLALGADADVDLISGASYCITVKVFNLAGLFSLKMSPPVLVDDAPPLAGWVNDGFDVTVAHLHFDPNDVDYQTSNEVIQAHWHSWEDEISGIYGYRCAVGTAPLSDDIVSWFFVAKETRCDASIAGLDIPLFTVVFVSVEGIDFGGLSAMISSDGVMLGPTPLGAVKRP